jgi:hypothetical protein
MVVPQRVYDEASLLEVVRHKYGASGPTGWAPRLRSHFGYFTPDDIYEAAVASLVTPKTAWLDVGCGRDIFPSNFATESSWPSAAAFWSAWIQAGIFTRINLFTSDFVVIYPSSIRHAASI